MPVVESGAVGHVLEAFETIESDLTDPIYDRGERLSALVIVVDKTDNGFPMQVIGSKGLLVQFLPHSGRGKDKHVKLMAVPGVLCPEQGNPLTQGLNDKQQKAQAPKPPRKRRVRDPETDELIDRADYIEKYGEEPGVVEDTNGESDE